MTDWLFNLIRPFIYEVYIDLAGAITGGTPQYTVAAINQISNVIVNGLIALVPMMAFLVLYKFIKIITERGF